MGEPQRPLITTDEPKAIPKWTFVVMKTGKHPMQTKLRLFLDWGITLVKRALHDLEKHGYIRRLPRYRESGSRSSNLYVIVDN